MNKIEAKFNRVKKMIEKYPQVFEYGPGASEAAIQEAEEQLNVTFPPLYRKFLEIYGYLVTEDESIWGIAPQNLEYDLVSQNDKFKNMLAKSGKPPLLSYLVGIQTFEESLICLDLKTKSYDGAEVKTCFYPPEKEGSEYLDDSFTELFYMECDNAISSYLDEQTFKKDNHPPSTIKETKLSSTQDDLYETAKQLILQHPELSELGDGYTKEEIAIVERELGVNFTGSYYTFLNEFGGGLFGENVFFALDDDELIKINLQLYHPTDYEHGLAKNLVAVYYDDLEDFYACLDYENKINGEPSVVYRNANVPEEDYDQNERLQSFAEFLLYIIKDTVSVNG
ncbi:SMI1/KNR4 family protein [Exiguobacterium sp. SL-10]|uniref:SMI1/KNR4 family protein n=1 Tax=Exiguobacterium sp. SL-10 TaxID=2510962 RepID=UPI00103B90B5|nr:SMI1/KNR4 family protein [Exiguobacterium sp. SL-10]TCI30664.1 SMI1/KNR4 family protein [Exiguobacterium sp. SL-10]